MSDITAPGATGQDLAGRTDSDRGRPSPEGTPASVMTLPPDLGVPARVTLWAMVLAVPLLFLRSFTGQIAADDERLLRLAIRRQLRAEMIRFERDLTFEHQVSQAARRVERRLESGGVASLPESPTALVRHLNAGFRHELGVEPILILAGGPDLESVAANSAARWFGEEGAGMEAVPAPESQAAERGPDPGRVPAVPVRLRERQAPCARGRVPSRTVIRELLRHAVRAETAPAYRPSSSLPAWQSAWRSPDPQGRRLQRLRFHLRTWITGFRLDLPGPGQTASVLSERHGGQRLIVRAHRWRTRRDGPIAGGYLVVFAACEFDDRAMLDRAIRHGRSRGSPADTRQPPVRRAAGLARMRAPTEWQDANAGLHLRRLMPWFLVRQRDLRRGGTPAGWPRREPVAPESTTTGVAIDHRRRIGQYRAPGSRDATNRLHRQGDAGATDDRDEGDGKRLVGGGAVWPVLQVTADRSTLRSPWRRLEPLIDISMLVSMAGLFLWLSPISAFSCFQRSSSRSWSLATRFAIGLALATAVPLACFFLGVASYRDQLRRTEKHQTQAELDQRLALLAQGLQGYITRVQADLLRLVPELVRAASGPDAALHHRLRQLAPGPLVRWIALQRYDGLHAWTWSDAGPTDAGDDRSVDREFMANNFTWMRYMLEKHYRSWRPTWKAPPDWPKAPKVNLAMVAQMIHDDPDLIRKLEGSLVSTWLPNDRMSSAVFLFLPWPTDADAEAAGASAHRTGSPTPYLGMVTMMVDNLEVARAYHALIASQSDDRVGTTRGWNLYDMCYLCDPVERRLLPSPAATWVEAAGRPLAAEVCRQSAGRWDRLDRVRQPGLFAGRMLQRYPLVLAAWAWPRPATGLAGDGWLALLPLGWSALVILVVSRLFTEAFLQPLANFRRGLETIAAGDYQSRIAVPGRGEFAQLAIGFNLMARGLAERERLSRFVSTRVLQLVQDRVIGTTGPVAASCQTGGDAASDCSVLVSDIRGFTTLSEQHPPATVVELLNDYFTRMESAIVAENGVVDKFVGDAVIALFNPAPASARRSAPPAGQAPGRGGTGNTEPRAPADQTAPALPLHPAVRAVRAGLAMRAALAELNRERAARGRFTIDNGIGIATGPVVSALVRSGRGRRELGIYGDCVTRAHRLEPRSKQGTATRIIVDAATAAAIAATHRCRELANPDPAGEPVALEVDAPA